MRRIAVLDAPSNLGLRPPTVTSVPGCAKAPGALRDHGLLSKLNARDAGCLTPPRYDAGDWRPGDGVAMAAQIANYSRALADRIGAILDAGEFPVVLGGDCSIVLGSGLAMNRLGEAVGGRIGLVFVDGHSDFRHPGNASYVGAAAGEDLALVTGRGQADLAAIEGRRPYFRDIDVVVMGIRAQDEYRLDLQAAGIVTRPVTALRAEGAARSAQWARDQLVDCAGYWVHIDVDVLDPAVMPAVDAPSPGGIAFPELEILLAGLVESPHCLGVEITVFDPDYDPDGAYASEIVNAVTAGLAAAHTVSARPDLIAARADLNRADSASRLAPMPAATEPDLAELIVADRGAAESATSGGRDADGPGVDSPELAIAERDDAGPVVAERDAGELPAAERDDGGSVVAERDAGGIPAAERDDRGPVNAGREPRRAAAVSRDSGGSAVVERDDYGYETAGRDDDVSVSDGLDADGPEFAERDDGGFVVAARDGTGSTAGRPDAAAQVESAPPADDLESTGSDSADDRPELSAAADDDAERARDRVEPVGGLRRPRLADRLNGLDLTAGFGRPERAAGLRRPDSPVGVSRSEPPTGLNRAEPPTGLNRAEPPTGLNRAEPPAGLNRAEPPAGLSRPDSTVGLNRAEPAVGPDQEDPPAGPSSDSSRTGPERLRSTSRLNRDELFGGVNRSGLAGGLGRPERAGGLNRQASSSRDEDERFAEEQERQHRRAAAAAGSVALAAAGMSDGPADAPEEVAIPATTLLGVERETDVPAEQDNVEDADPPDVEARLPDAETDFPHVRTLADSAEIQDESAEDPAGSALDRAGSAEVQADSGSGRAGSAQDRADSAENEADSPRADLSAGADLRQAGGTLPPADDELDAVDFDDAAAYDEAIVTYRAEGDDEAGPLAPRPLGSAPLLDSEPLPATRPGMLRPRVSEEQDSFSLPVQRPAFELGSDEPADIA